MKNKLFHFQIEKSTITGMISGLFMILLSVSMNLFPDNEIVQIILRDVLMIFFLGFVFPLYFILIRKKGNLSVLGIHREKWKSSLLIDVILAAALLFMFLRGSTNPVTFNVQSFFAVSYIFVAGIFEMLFIYGFLRYIFEKAFGIIPAIMLTAVFYSLHHAGFQPEFRKLFWVGLMYVCVFYITRNLLIIFPFFWGVGAVFDVLANSEAGREIENKESFVIAVLLLFAMMIVASFISFLVRRDFLRKRENMIHS